MRTQLEQRQLEHGPRRFARACHPLREEGALSRYEMTLVQDLSPPPTSGGRCFRCRGGRKYSWPRRHRTNPGASAAVSQRSPHSAAARQYRAFKVCRSCFTHHRPAPRTPVLGRNHSARANTTGTKVKSSTTAVGAPTCGIQPRHVSWHVPEPRTVVHKRSVDPHDAPLTPTAHQLQRGTSRSSRGSRPCATPRHYIGSTDHRGLMLPHGDRRPTRPEGHCDAIDVRLLTTPPRQRPRIRRHRARPEPDEASGHYQTPRHGKFGGSSSRPQCSTACLRRQRSVGPAST